MSERYGWTPAPIGWQYDDGGRAAAGYRGDAGDCAVRAIAIATGHEYADVYRALTEHGRDVIAARRKPRKHKSANDPSPRTGTSKPAIERYLAAAGWTWTPTMSIGSGCRVHLRADELPAGRIICQVSRHLCAVVDGTIHDTHDPSRDGTRCVYGYWSAP